MEDVRINYGFIARAVEHYVDAGFRLIEVPWVVDPAITNYTCGDRHKVYTTLGGDLIGSAEQGFIALQLGGKLPDGRYVAVSPCFRYGDSEVDTLHREYFMKVELFSNLEDAGHERDVLLNHAYMLFRKLGANNLRVSNTFVKDIFINDIEVGSYGCRMINGKHFTYGTGLAEPRFSRALKGTT